MLILELLRTEIAERGAQSTGVVDLIDEARKVGSDIVERLIGHRIDDLDLERFHEALGLGVIIRIAAAERQAARAELATVDREVVDARTRFDGMRHDATEDQLYARFTAAWDTYRGIVDQVLLAIEAGRGGEAIDLYLGPSRSAHGEASDLLARLTGRNAERARLASLEAESSYRTTLIVASLALAVAAILLLVARTVTRIHLSVPLMELAATMQQLSRNSLIAHVPSADRGDEIGEMARAVLVFRDNAVALAENRRKLEAQAELLARTLAQEKRLKSLQQQFVTTASHEFGTPLNVIDGHAQRLAKLADHISPANIRDRAARIRRAVLRITNQIDDLIDFGRIEDPGEADRLERVDLGKVLHEVVALHREMAPDAPIEVVSEPGIFVLGDRRQLFHLFSNLVANAVKYSPPSKPIRITAVLKGVEARVSVSDNGVGFPSADLPRLFAPGARGANVASTAGSGMGLYIAARLAETLGGKIAAHSVEGQGATFIVTLAILPDEPFMTLCSEADHPINE